MESVAVVIGITRGYERGEEEAHFSLSLSFF